MKKKTLLPLFLLAIVFRAGISQVADGINYQAVALDENKKEIAGRDLDGTVFYNRQIDIRFTIVAGSIEGTIVYSEMHTTLTDAYGLFSLTIGHGEPLLGNFADIKWSSAPHFLKVEMDHKRNGNFLVMGTQQLMAVPYALHALSADFSEESDPKFNSSEAAKITNSGSGSVISATERTKLDGIEAGANQYIHPLTHPAEMIEQNAQLRFVSDSEKAA